MTSLFEMKDDLGAALFHAQDLREAIESLNVNSTNKNAIKSEITVWHNSAALVESILRDAIKKLQ